MSVTAPHSQRTRPRVDASVERAFTQQLSVREPRLVFGACVSAIGVLLDIGRGAGHALVVDPLDGRVSVLPTGYLLAVLAARPVPDIVLGEMVEDARERLPTHALSMLAELLPAEARRRVEQLRDKVTH